MSVLSQILADKRNEVDCAKRRCPQGDVMGRASDSPSALDFIGALTCKCGLSLIAEVKKASPSKGVIREDFDPVEIARIYENNGAACISVLTDEKYFQGHLRYLLAIREAVAVPLLRKDFIIDPYQIYEARAAGADAILLIVAALTESEIRDFRGLALELGMAALVEVHDAEEAHLAIRAGANLIGINNRSLHTFRTTLETTLEILPMMPTGAITVSESGINSRHDVERLQVVGVNAILVGEALMREVDIATKVRELISPITPCSVI